MSLGTPPPLPAELERAALAVKRAAAFARVSALTMLVLGGLSLALSGSNAVSASFAISAAIVVNGWIELRLGRCLLNRIRNAPGRLALNQLAVGGEIVAYAWWQMETLGPDQIDALVQRPLIAHVLEAFPREIARDVLARLPGTIGLLYVAVGTGAFIGCALTAWYYASRSRPLALLAAVPAPSARSNTP